MVLKYDLFAYRDASLTSSRVIMRNKQPTINVCTISEMYPTVLETTVIAFNYHDELEITTQDERGMNRL